jgi:hypothetical protein
MGRNKKLRKDIRGEIRVINKHLAWIEEELKKPYPDRRAILKWEQDIERHQRKLAQLTSRLPGRKT